MLDGQGRAGLDRDVNGGDARLGEEGAGGREESTTGDDWAVRGGIGFVRDGGLYSESVGLFEWGTFRVVV